MRVDYELTVCRRAGVASARAALRPLVCALGRRVADMAVLRYRREAPGPTLVCRGRRPAVRAAAGHLRLGRPHVVGHSSRRTRRAGARPAGRGRPAVPRPARTRHGRAGRAGRRGGADGAADRAGRVGGRGGRDGPVPADHLRRRGPRGARRARPRRLGDAVAHAPGFFGVELPAAVRWSFAASDVTGITVPVLYVRGAASAPRFAEGGGDHRVVVPRRGAPRPARVNHLLMAQAPEETAELLRTFWRANGSTV